MERDQLEKLTREYQMLQEQLQALAAQREQLTMQKEEYKSALTELETATGKVYIAVGGVMVNSDKETAQKNIKEKQESVELKLSIISKQYDESSKSERAMREQISAALKELKQ